MASLEVYAAKAADNTAYHGGSEVNNDGKDPNAKTDRSNPKPTISTLSTKWQDLFIHVKYY